MSIKRNSLSAASAIICSVITVMALTGCVSVNLSGVGGEKVSGKGDLMPYEYQVDDFSSVEVIATNIELIYVQGTSDMVAVEIQENLTEYLDVYTEDGRLFIETSKSFTSNLQKPKFYITSPEITGIYIYGGVTIKDSDTLTSDVFELGVSGACDASLNLDVESLSMWVSGAGDVNLVGRADSANIEISGAGTVDALDLSTMNSTVQINGAGACSLAVRRPWILILVELPVSITGATPRSINQFPVQEPLNKPNRKPIIYQRILQCGRCAVLSDLLLR